MLKKKMNQNVTRVYMNGRYQTEPDGRGLRRVLFRGHWARTYVEKKRKERKEKKQIECVAR